MMITEFIVDKVLETAFDRVVSLFKEKKTKINFSIEDIRESLGIHQKYISNWSKEISFEDLSKPKSLLTTYIPLDYFVAPVRTTLVRNNFKKVSLEQALKNKEFHKIILGQPGAGKSTSMKYICQNILFNENYELDFDFPIVVRFREAIDFLKEKRQKIKSNIYYYLFNLVGFKLNQDLESLDSEEINSFIEKVVFKFLDNSNSILILDGLDEIPNYNYKKTLIRDLEKMFLSVSSTLIILTTRTGDYNFSIANSEVYEICNLNNSQIKMFIEKWILDSEKSQELYNQLSNSPYFDSTIRPITLAHLCAIFQRDGNIPDKPKTLYRKIINLYLEEWTRQNSVERITAYTNFEVDRKFEFLSEFAFNLTIKYKVSVFDEDILKKIYYNVYEKYSLPQEDCLGIMNEIESHNGIIIQSEYKTFEFVHKSLQEFLAADYIVRLPYFPFDINMLNKIPNEMALAVSISSDPVLFLVNLYQLFEDQFHNYKFQMTFLSRLLLEKPDFTPSEMLAVVLLSTYSNLMIEFMNKKNNDDLKKVFEIFDRLSCFQPIKKSYRLVINGNYYEIKNKTDYDTNDVLTLQKIKNITKTCIKQPDELYMNSNWIK